MKGKWKKIRRLLIRFEQGVLTDSEAQELEDWYNSVDFNEMPLLTDEQFVEESYFNEKYDDLMERVANRGKASKIIRMNYGAVAAAVAILLIAGIFWFTTNRKNLNQSTIAKSEKIQVHVEDILPGHEGAVLSLSDGKRIILDSAAEGRIAKQGNVMIDNMNGVLTYQAKNATTEKVELNTLTTPSGREYKVELPDGSRVWLNASSSLTFPTAFSKEERNVILQGEAYFEVAKFYLADGRRKPFKITINTNLGQAHKVEMEVLGTSFNVNAYSNEADIKTTLVEGSVKIHSDGIATMLAPLRQAVIRKDGETTIISNVNMKRELAWRDGVFYFDHNDIHSILRQFSRWYDIDIISNDTGQNRSFSGKINRNVKLVDVLKIMDLSNIQYTMEGKKMIIKNLGSE